MQVVKRSGDKELVHFDKISTRLNKLLWNIQDGTVDCSKIAQKIVSSIFDGIHTETLDELASETAQSMIVNHPNYGILASRIVISNMHKNTDANILNVYKTLLHKKLVASDFYNIVEKYHNELQEIVNYDMDYNFDYFGYKTLERSYLLKIDNIIIERPQHLFLRVCIQIHGEDMSKVKESYDFITNGYFTHATPTLFNSGSRYPQLASCFLMAMKEDSIEGIYDTLKNTALISKYAGGIGLSIHDIRGRNSVIKSSGRTSSGTIPMLKNFEATAKYVDQNGKRPGSIAIYEEPWHPDILEFLDLRKNHGDENARARDLFTALWIPDLFMKRVKENKQWCLMSSNESPGLSDVYGKEFEELYEKYESEGKYIKKVNAQDIWNAILTSQTETGTPYILFKDACNEKSNQKNLGTIKSSNLCAEIVEWSGPDETAVCNLASICLPKFVNNGQFDFDKLKLVTKVVTNNLNNVIDNSFYPIQEAKNSNMRHRPIGIGTQGLADTFMKLKIPFDSDDAKQLNKDIFETIYHGSLEMSCQLAKEHGTYSSYKDSPISKGILQYDMWGVQPSQRWDWKTLKENIHSFGVRNSLCLAQMPTASTSQIMGNSESIDALTSNLFNRRTSSGEFTCINKYLIDDLQSIGMWNSDTMNHIIQHDGSVQTLGNLPQEIKNVYKTVWEISQKHVIDMASDRGAFICQSQSMNLYIAKPSTKSLSSMYFYAHSKGLKTGVYYLRTKPNVSAVKVAIPFKKVENDTENVDMVCSRSEGCITCSS